MNKKKRKCKERRRFVNTKSIYIRWMFTLTVTIFFAQVITFALSAVNITKELNQNMVGIIVNKAEAIREVFGQDDNLTKAAIALLQDTEVHFSKVDDLKSEDSEKYGKLVTLEMLDRAYSGEIVVSESQYTHRLVFGIVKIGEDIYLLTPNLLDGKFVYIMKYFQRSMIFGALISAGCIVLAIFFCLRPIKKVIAATKEVAKGNFEVKVNHKSYDEVGQLIENFNNMADELSKVSYFRKDFVSSVSHEFKTPITSIEGFARILQSDDISNEQRKEYTDIIISETKRLSNLSSNLLKISLLDSGNMESEKTVFSLAEQIRNAILLLEQQWSAKNISFDIEMAEVNVLANEELVYQVWINLLQNAIKFSYVSGAIRVRLSESNEVITAKIENKGKSITDLDKKRMFERFYKGDSSRSSEGSGLGLTIVKKILDNSGGSISAENIDDEYVSFIVTLPKGNVPK